MAKSSKKTATKKADNSKVEARPIGAGKDPLAEGNTLENPTNSEAETHYNVKERGEDVQATENTINGQNANERAEQHNTQLAQGAPDHDTPNQGQPEQDAVAEGRVDPAAEQAADDTPEEVEVPEVSEEDQAAADAERRDAVDTALDTTDKPS